MHGRKTSRLLLREWREEDKPAFAATNADPAVARFLPSVLTRSESDAMVDRIVAHFATHGFGVWAVDELACAVPARSGAVSRAVADGAVNA